MALSELREKISREHVLKVLEKIDRGEIKIPERRKFRTAYILHNGNKYPPKYVLEKAAEEAGLKIGPEDFITDEAANFLKKLGFEVLSEEDSETDIEKTENKRQKIIEKTLNSDVKSEEESLIDSKIKEELESILNNKKQVILYGPPGTGKTWLAHRYIAGKEKKLEIPIKKSEIGYFIYAVKPSNLNPKDLKEGESYEILEGKYRTAYEKIDNGDVVFIYIGHPYGRVFAIGEYEKREDKGYVKIKKVFEGVDRDRMNEIIHGRQKAGVRLIDLSVEEAYRLAKESGLSEDYISENLQIKIDSTEELEISRFDMVTFHPSYSYEEFVEGIRVISENEQVRYFVEDGIFKKIALKAICMAILNSKFEDLKALASEIMEYLANGDSLSRERYSELKKSLWGKIEKMNREEVIKLFSEAPEFYLLIDEINRGDISRIFGELITLLEADKRLSAENESIVTLPYSKEKFGVPPNLYIIATMNTADRSIALIDVALRRRFGFIELMPDYELLEKRLLSGEDSAKEVKKLTIEVLKSMNEKIKQLYDRDHQIGHSYFLRLEKCNSKKEAIRILKEIWYYEIIPLLQEYFYDSPEKLKEVAGNFVILEKDGNSYEIKKNFSDEDFIKELRNLAGERVG